MSVHIKDPAEFTRFVFSRDGMHYVVDYGWLLLDVGGDKPVVEFVVRYNGGTGPWFTAEEKDHREFQTFYTLWQATSDLGLQMTRMTGRP